MGLYFSNSLLSFILLKLEESLLFDSIQMLPLDFFNLFLIVFVKILHFLNVLSNCYFLSINSILMSLVEISFFSQLLPSRLRLISNYVSLLQFNFHGINFGSKFGILVMHVSYQSDLNVVEGSFLLELMPLLLKDVQRLGHRKLLQEISNEIINYNISVERLWCSISNPSNS